MTFVPQQMHSIDPSEVTGTLVGRWAPWVIQRFIEGTSVCTRQPPPPLFYTVFVRWYTLLLAFGTRVLRGCSIGNAVFSLGDCRATDVQISVDVRLGNVGYFCNTRRTLFSVALSYPRNRALILLNPDNTNGDSLLHMLGLLRVPHSNALGVTNGRFSFAGAPSSGTVHSLHHGINVIFRRCGL